MSKARHTPGPWRVEFEPEQPEPAIMAGDLYVATVHLGVSADEEHVVEANARLIAAAPETAAERNRLREVNAELLEALEEAQRIIRRRAATTIAECKFLDASDAAIAKARGLSGQVSQ